MKLDTIELPVKEAREKVAEYRRAVRQRHTEEDEAILRGYRALAKGQALVDVAKAVRAGGRFDDMAPKIAVCAADAVWCYLDMDCSGTVTFSPNMDHEPDRQVSWYAWRRRSHFPDLFEEIDWDMWCKLPVARNVRTQVPIVPPALRPAGSLRPYHILWEVEQWAKRPRPPGDPALLKHVSGTLYAVVATWDLTELERAVLGARL